MVAVLVLVRESKTYAARESFWDSGDADFARSAERRCALIVVFPDPDSPLFLLTIVIQFHGSWVPYKKTTAWFSERAPSLRYALSAIS